MQLFDERDLAQPSRLTESHSRLLIALAELDCSKHDLAALLAPANLHQDHIRFLTGPIVQHRSPWAETTPEWLYRAVTADRLRIILVVEIRRKIPEARGLRRCSPPVQLLAQYLTSMLLLAYSQLVGA